MGGFNASKDQMVQELSGVVRGMFSTPAYWQGTVPSVGLQNMIYTIGVTDEPKMFVISNGLIQTPPVSASSAILIAYPGASPVISANGTTGGILWAIDSSAWESAGTAVLYAFDATNMTLLYNSNQFSADNPGPAVKFTVPTVANGSVYMGTQTQLAVFGLFPGGRGAPTPTATATATASATTSATATNTTTATPTASITATATIHLLTVAALRPGGAALCEVAAAITCYQLRELARCGTCSIESGHRNGKIHWLYRLHWKVIAMQP
jgi:hypothetical protein